MFLLGKCKHSISFIPFKYNYVSFGKSAQFWMCANAQGNRRVWRKREPGMNQNQIKQNKGDQKLWRFFLSTIALKLYLLLFRIKESWHRAARMAIRRALHAFVGLRPSFSKQLLVQGLGCLIVEIVMAMVALCILHLHCGLSYMFDSDWLEGLHLNVECTDRSSHHSKWIC